jgi:membrane protein YdbS with pleckstrin-like domain
MSGYQIKFERIPTWSVVLGVVLLCGVLSMAYGFYQNSQTALYVGLAVTILGALDGILFLTILPGELRFPRHRQ